MTGLPSGAPPGPDAEIRLETDCATLCYTGGVLKVEFRPGRHVGVADARALLAAHRDRFGEHPVPVLVVLDGMASIDEEARRVLASEDCRRLCQAAALLAASPVGRVIGGFFQGLNRPPFPTRLCSDEQEALRWLQAGLSSWAP